MSENAMIQSGMNPLGYFGKPKSNRDKMEQVRVALYARVSTQHEEQIHALEAQKIWLKSLCELHPNWQSVRMYVDEGLSGTVIEKRQGFLDMLKDAREGKFDLILTREVCRFARNTVDSLNITRSLADMGVEVFFYNDNIWSLDSDGELRLTIMSAMAQEESRKISERVFSGQATSRKKGILYGSGNIYGYKLVRGETSVDNTYEIIPEEAENVRLVYCLYLSGLGIQAISKKMVEMEKKGIDGKTVWSNGKIWNILRNKTYAGFRCYGKSITNNYLTHRRIKNKDRHTYIYQKADFPAIVSEEDWEEVQKIMDSRSDIRNGKRVGIKTETDIWKKKLVCSCGKTFKKYHWRTNKNQVAMYGYACRNVVENRSKEARREMEVELNGMCNVKSFPEWRLEFIFLKIMERMMKNPERMVNKLVAVVEKNYIPDRNTRIHKETAVIKKDMEQAEKRLENLLSGYLDGCIDIADYKEKKEELEKSYKEMKEEYEFLVPTEESREKSLDEKRESLKQVKEKLWELLDREQTQVDKKLVDKIVKKITPCPDSVFKWYLNFKGSETESETDILADSFAIGFEEAEAYRKKCGSFLRKSQWNDILVEVYIGV